MNRKQKRALAKKLPGYNKILKQSTSNAFDDFKKMLEKQWEEKNLENADKKETETKNDGTKIDNN